MSDSDHRVSDDQHSAHHECLRLLYKRTFQEKNLLKSCAIYHNCLQYHCCYSHFLLPNWFSIKLWVCGHPHTGGRHNFANYKRINNPLLHSCLIIPKKMHAKLILVTFLFIINFTYDIMNKEGKSPDEIANLTS